MKIERHDFQFWFWTVCAVIGVVAGMKIYTFFCLAVANLWHIAGYLKGKDNE